MSGSVTLAFAAGLLATVNPCGFAMLPSFLGLYLGHDGQTTQRRSPLARASDGFSVGVVLSAGFAGMLVFAGLLIAAGLRFFLGAVPWLALVIGAVLTVVGVALAAGRHVGIPRASRLRLPAGDQSGYRRVALFGMGYAVASVSCTLATFLVVVSQAAAAPGPLATLLVFGAYTAGSATVLVSLSLSAALAQGVLARWLGRLLPIVGRVSGLLLAASGAYLILYWLPGVLDGESGGSSLAADLSRGVVSNLGTFFSDNVGAFAIILVGLIILGAVLLGASAPRGSRRRAGREAAEEATVSPEPAAPEPVVTATGGPGE